MFKQLLTILLVATIMAESLLPKGVGLSQDFKFGEVVAHFQEHRDVSGINFSDFIWMHYAAESAHKSQNHHDNLPNLDGHQMLFVLSHQILLTTFTTNAPITILDGLSASHYLNSYHFLYSFDLLNPPQEVA